MSITDDVIGTSDGSNNTTTSSLSADVKKTAPPPIDLLTCQPDELASWLIAHRFQNNAMDVASFLLTCTAALPNAEEISAHLMGSEEEKNEATEEKEEPNDNNTGDDATSSAVSNNLGEPIKSFSSHEVSCINPRGKFVLSLHSNGVMLKNPKKDEERIIIPKAAVEHTVWFRKPEDYKSLKQLKEGSKKPIPGHMVLICLEDGITFRNKDIKQICLQLPSYAAGPDSNQEDWYDGLNSALLSKNKRIIRVVAKMDYQASKTKKGEFMFQAGLGASGNTSTTTAAFPFVGCNRGFNNGALFPLREGLLFFKPPLFLPRSNLASISCGRGSGQSRFVDMVVQLVDDDDSTLEFTNIERDELQGLNQYIHSVLIPAMKQDAARGSDNAGDEEDGDEDEDVAMAEVVNSSDEDSDSEESSAKCKRKSSRAASKSAREVTRAHFAGLNGDDDDDDDSGAESFHEGEDDSEGSDEDNDSDLSDSEVSEDNVESEEEERGDDSDDGDGSFEVERNKRARVD